MNTSEGSDAMLQVNNTEETDTYDDEGLSNLTLNNHLSLALHDIDQSSLSTSSIEQGISLEDYLRDRWSHSSSFD